MKAVSILTQPARDILLLKLHEPLLSESFYAISDISGNQLCIGRMLKTKDNVISIGVDFLKRGMYLLMVMHHNDFTINSFVKL